MSTPDPNVTTHVLDASRGRPAAGVPLRLERIGAGHPAEHLADAVTDSDGRVAGFDIPQPGTYRLTFDTAAYFTRTGQDTFYPEVSITFTLADPAQHYHVPLLLSPFAYSTYRGS